MTATNNLKSRLALLLVLALPTVFSGCKKILEVQPEDQYTEYQVFSNETTIQQAINGLYTALSDDALYGLQLTQIALEYLGQQYVPFDWTDYWYLYTYEYKDVRVANILQNVWGRSYEAILKTNKFLEKLEGVGNQDIIKPPQVDQLRGEALAMRAFLHFDLLRLFGPVYSSGPDQPAIPYNTVTKAQTHPILSAKEVLAAVLTDLNAAADLLVQDPIINNGTQLNGTADFYSRYRNRRFNYFAVKGLLSRAYLYGGFTEEAHAAAKEVLDEGEKWFPWLEYTAILNAGLSPDRIFSTEVIFGLHNRNLYTNFTDYFSTSVESVIRADDDILDMTFEYNIQDYRYAATWIRNTTWGGRTLIKYADIPDQTKNWRFFQPLLRKSELYYILAETESDPQQALAYLNTVRFNRGLTDLPPGSSIQEEVMKEYQKEFFGEGQLFYYYKRKNEPYITTTWAEPIYTPPLPESETRLR